MAVCGLVFLIVCANLSSLLLARSIARGKEFSVGMAVGASVSESLWKPMTRTRFRGTPPPSPEQLKWRFGVPGAESLVVARAGGV